MIHFNHSCCHHCAAALCPRLPDTAEAYECTENEESDHWTIMIQRICLRRRGSFDQNPEELYISTNLMTNYDVSCLLMTPPAQTFSHRQQLHLCNFAFFYCLMAIYFIIIHFISTFFINLKKSLFIKNSIIS